ncbi:DMT family transporter [uncultured Ilyobacter sp.]|uniref:DMT family transporter n=1 Tax=uncultured Ilyobacter sp. TaxID=544433 RepID=UPI0029C794F8|nr:DMT family transporter [uncultured Ilyobacter sp.]
MKNKYIGYVMAFITIFVWGTTYAITKNLLNYFTPLEALFLRFLIAYLFLMIIKPTFNFKFNFQEEKLFLFLGLTGGMLYFLVENLALKYTSASNVGLIVSSIPIFSSIIAHFTTEDEKFDTNLLLGFALAVTGIFIILYNGNKVLKLNPIGDILAVVCSIIWAVYSNLLRKVDNSYSGILLVRKTFFYGLIFMLPVLYVFKVKIHFEYIFNKDVSFSIFYLALVASCICFIMWSRSINIIGVIKTTNFVYLIPLVAMISSMLLLDEKITPLMIVGGALILSGVLINDKKITLGKLFKAKAATTS